MQSVDDLVRRALRRTTEQTMNGTGREREDRHAGSPGRAPGPSTAPVIDRLIHLTLRDFVDQVGEPLPRAGGGAVAAFIGALAAALLSMVCRLTTTRNGDEAAAGGLRTTCAAAEFLKTTLLAAVDADTEAYLAVVAAGRLPRDTPEERAVRDEAVAAARRRAAAVPLGASAACLEVLEQASALSDGMYRVAASELAVSVQAAMTCIRAGAVDVAVNLKHLDREDTADMRRRMDDIESRALATFGAVWPALNEVASCATE
jgi:formiminotetrahydrofolate cyclodeaminase